MYSYAANWFADAGDFAQFASRALNMVNVDQIDLVSHRLKAYACPVGPIPDCMPLGSISVRTEN
jgi:hypothetical protein